MFLLIFWEDGAVHIKEEVTEEDKQCVDDGYLSIVRMKDGECQDWFEGKFIPILPLNAEEEEAPEPETTEE